MTNQLSYKGVFRTILDGRYTPSELNDFVRICYSLALPHIRRKIQLGKINLNAIGMSENDVVYDCLADLFHRDQSGTFPQITMFFRNQLVDIEEASEEHVLITLRRLVLGKVNNNIVRLYSEADPALAKIIRNVKLGIERTGLFELEQKFGEVHLIPRGIVHRTDLPGIPAEVLREEIVRVILIHDPIPNILRKLHTVLLDQRGHQASVSLVQIALLIKEVYALDSIVSVENDEYLDSGEQEDIQKVLDRVCQKLASKKRASYVVNGKLDGVTFDLYISLVREILLENCSGGPDAGRSYFEWFRTRLPDLTHQEYMERHRVSFEYLVRLAREMVAKEFPGR